MKKFDYLVIGGGIAGLTFALEVADRGSVAVLFKKEATDSSTAWAQGGIAVVSTPEDDFDSHINDTLGAGAGLSDPSVVDFVVKEAPKRIEELIARGARFDKSESGYDLHQEGGHSQRRILHNADSTGWEIQRALIVAAEAHKNITFFSNHNAIDLITTHKLGLSSLKENKVLGAYVLQEDNRITPFVSSSVLLATGGAGKVYLYTSNPDVASGDGIAMCYRAGVPVVNMEFFQFHPTCLFHPKAKSFLISEALRGEGAVITRIKGERFLPRYHDNAELAPRDVVARAIDNEMKIHGEEHVLLDISHKGKNFVEKHFPSIYKRCLEYGFNLGAEPIPVVPAAHYCCGGVACTEHGETNIKGLYVAGEVSYTGLHGANRLASNSLLEGVVFAYRAAQHALEQETKLMNIKEIPPWNKGNAVDSDEEVMITQNWDEIRRCMWNFVGIVRSDKRLARAKRRIDMIQDEINQYYWDFRVTSDLLELRNLCLVAKLIIESASLRKESRGLHYNIDYPDSVASLAKPTIVSADI